MPIIFYNVIVFSSIFFFYLSVAYEKAGWLKYISIAILFFVSAIRLGIGTDYYAYETNFNGLSTDKLFGSFEPLFRLINIAISEAGFDFRGVIVITSFLFLYPISKCADKRISVWMFSYFVIVTYFFSFNVIRQAIALSISAFALYRLVYFNDNKKYFILIITATLFHYTALLGMLVFLFRKRALPAWLNLSIIFFFYFFISKITSVVFNSSFFEGTKYIHYLASDYMDGAQLGSGVGLFFVLFPYFAIVIFNGFIFEKGVKRNIIVNSSVLVILMKILTLNISIFYRFEWSLVFLITYIFTELAINCRRNYLSFMVFSYFTIWTLLQFELQLLLNYSDVVPYNSVLGGL